MIKDMAENKSLGGRIKTGGRFVQDQNLRPLQYSASNRQTLSLTSRELATIWSNAMMKTAWKCRHYIGEVSQTQRFAQFAI